MDARKTPAHHTTARRGRPGLSRQVILPLLALVAFLLLAGVAGPAFAQAADRPEGDKATAPVPPEEPWLRINAGGHTAAVHALAYLPDGHRLCSAGLDKSVLVWNLKAVARDLRRTFLRERTIRWQVARGLRGSLYALAASPSDGLLAMGGYGAMGSLGEILLVNPVEGTLAKVLQGHRQTICSLAFSSDGNWLASSDASGRAMVWRRGQWQPHTLYDSDAKTYDAELARLIRQQPKLRPIEVLGSREVVVPVCVGRQADGRPGWNLQQIRLDDPEKYHTLDTLHRGMVTALAASRDGSLLASSDLTGRLFLWDWKAGGPPAELRPQAVVLSLSFSPDGRILAVGTAIDPAQKAGHLQIWDVAARSLLRSRSLPDHVHTCVVSPDGKDVAYGGGKNNEVFLEAVDASGQTVALRGSGRRILKVAFARTDPPYRIAFGTRPRGERFNEYAELEERFDPVRLDLGAGEPVSQADWLSPAWCRGGWTAELRPDGSLQTYRNGKLQGKVVLDPVSEGRLRSYCWIADGKGETFAVAAGTDLQNGIYVYRLVREGRCPMLRYFRGHHDFVTSVAVSRDLRYLASSSADGTIIFWSLALLEQGADVRGRWGADFSVKGKDLVARDVHPAGPLFARGVRDGDVLREIRWNDGKADHVESRPEAMRERLGSLPWDTQVAFEISRGGVRRPAFQRLPAWQPLATLFVGEDREWAFWTPQGYYDASINGYTLFGWQVNRGLDVLPDFYRADQFRKRLERPDVMERLLPAGSLEEAFSAAKAAPPADPQQVLPAQIAATPRVEILSPRPGQVVEGNATTLRARITMPAEGKLVAAKVFANGVPAVAQHLVGERPRAGGREFVYDWNVRLPGDPRNLIQLIVGTDAPTAALSDVLVERPAGVRIDREARLRLVAMGIDKYRDPAIQPLRFAVADAESVAKTIRERANGLYSVDRAVVVTNEHVTPEHWRKALDDVCRDLKESPRPDDLLVLFFAGHGILDSQSKQYYFVGHDFTVEDLNKRQYAACIGWNDFRMLASVPCRKLVLLDTCHAGAVQPLRARDLKAAVRDLQDDVIFTFAASAGDELSAENKAWRHGAFTRAFTEALHGADRTSQTPVITLNQVIHYVQAEVRNLTKNRQNPTAAPEEILPFTSVLLAQREHEPQPEGEVSEK